MVFQISLNADRRSVARRKTLLALFLAQRGTVVAARFPFAWCARALRVACVAWRHNNSAPSPPKSVYVAWRRISHKTVRRLYHHPLYYHLCCCTTLQQQRVVARIALCFILRFLRSARQPWRGAYARMRRGGACGCPLLPLYRAVLRFAPTLLNEHISLRRGAAARNGIISSHCVRWRCVSVCALRLRALFWTQRRCVWLARAHAV